MSEDEMSEQCCVLNVWTKDVKTRKPVMLWLHGGGFDSGTSAWDPGMCLAQKDVVVVSINHRLNIRIRNNPDRELEEIINRHCFKQLDAFKKRN